MRKETLKNLTLTGHIEDMSRKAANTVLDNFENVNRGTDNYKVKKQV